LDPLATESKFQHLVKWKTTLEGWVKINSDATFVAETGKGAGGVVMRNSQGEVLVVAA
jgi:hypothetical protein